MLSLHSCLHHGEAEQGGRPVELYEINQDATEARLRAGTHITQADEWGLAIAAAAGKGGIRPEVGRVLGWAVQALWERGMVRGRELEEVSGQGVWEAVQAAERTRQAEAAVAAAAGAAEVKPRKGKGKEKIESLQDGQLPPAFG